MVFSIFNITHIENIVNDKYKIKKLKIDGIVIFFTIINHMKANTNSRRSLRLTEIIVCKVWLSGSLVRPLKKMIRVKSTIIKKREDKIAIS